MTLEEFGDSKSPKPTVNGWIFTCWLMVLGCPCPFRFKSPTVDGRHPANQLRLAVYPRKLQIFFGDVLLVRSKFVGFLRAGGVQGGG